MAITISNIQPFNNGSLAGKKFTVAFSSSYAKPEVVTALSLGMQNIKELRVNSELGYQINPQYSSATVNSSVNVRVYEGQSAILSTDSWAMVDSDTAANGKQLFLGIDKISLTPFLAADLTNGPKLFTSSINDKVFILPVSISTMTYQIVYNADPAANLNATQVFFRPTDAAGKAGYLVSNNNSGDSVQITIGDYSATVYHSNACGADYGDIVLYVDDDAATGTRLQANSPAGTNLAIASKNDDLGGSYIYVYQNDTAAADGVILYVDDNGAADSALVAVLDGGATVTNANNSKAAVELVNDLLFFPIYYDEDGVVGDGFFQADLTNAGAIDQTIMTRVNFRRFDVYHVATPSNTGVPVYVNTASADWALLEYVSPTNTSVPYLSPDNEAFMAAFAGPAAEAALGADLSALTQVEMFAIGD